MPVFQLQERHNEYLSPTAKSAISRAKTSWLKNTDVVDLLVNHERYRLPVSSDPPNKPAGRIRYVRAKTELKYRGARLWPCLFTFSHSDHPIPSPDLGSYWIICFMLLASTSLLPDLPWDRHQEEHLGTQDWFIGCRRHSISV